MQSGQLAETFSQLIAAIGHTSFGRSLFETIVNQVEIDHCTGFVLFNDRVQPLFICARNIGVEDHAISLAEEYVESGWTSDPILGDMHKGSRQFFGTQLLDPRVAFGGVYRQKFYDRPKIQQEVACSGSVSGANIYIGLYRRKGQPVFTSDEVEVFRTLEKPILHACAKHFEVRNSFDDGQDWMSQTPVSREELFAEVKRVLQEDQGGLSAREVEVCAGIVLGYSANALGLNLGISENTVATHRKRAYAKLNICSQNELFTRFLTQNRYRRRMSAFQSFNPLGNATMKARHAES